MTIGISGHQNIPDVALSFVEQSIRNVLNAYENARCVSSLAVGADQVFAQISLVCGASLYVVIPSQQYETTFFADQDKWQYQALLKQATATETLNFAQPSEEAFLSAGMRVVDLSELLIAVWDGESAVGKGGTADVVAYAQRQGKPVVIAWPEGLKR